MKMIRTIAATASVVALTCGLAAPAADANTKQCQFLAKRAWTWQAKAFASSGYASDFAFMMSNTYWDAYLAADC